MENETVQPQPQPLPQIPNLPTGTINENTVDCVNVSIHDYPIFQLIRQRYAIDHFTVTALKSTNRNRSSVNNKTKKMFVCIYF